MTDEFPLSQQLEGVLAQFESLTPGPPFIRCVIFEWEDTGQGARLPSSPTVRRKIVEQTEDSYRERLVVSGSDVGKAISCHPAVRAASVSIFNFTKLGNPSLYKDRELKEFSRFQGYPDSPRFTSNLLWGVQWLLDPSDAPGSGIYRGRVVALNRTACNALNSDEPGDWAGGYSDLRLVFEIIQRLSLRRQTCLSLGPISKRLWWVDCEKAETPGHPFATIIDDFVADSKVVLRQIIKEAISPESVEVSSPRKIKPTPETIRIIRSIQSGKGNNEVVRDNDCSVGVVRKVRSHLKADRYEI